VSGAAAGRTGLRYWLIVLLLLALGLLTIFSIGLYFWFIALALVVLSPFRSRARVFQSGIALFLGFLVGYVLVAPWGCTQSFTSDPTTGEETRSPIVCSSPIGIEYAGSEPFDPSRVPALIAGIVTGVIASGVTLLTTRSNDDERQSLAGTPPIV
jgi:hypothetical protein